MFFFSPKMFIRNIDNLLPKLLRKKASKIDVLLNVDAIAYIWLPWCQTKPVLVVSAVTPVLLSHNPFRVQAEGVMSHNRPQHPLSL